MSILQKIKWTPISNGQYIRKETVKNTIYIHHTAGNANPYGVLRWWEETPERVGTSFVIGGKPTLERHKWKDGDLIQAFSSKYWAYHLGLKKSNMPPGSASSKVLNSQAIGIEICNWGPLEKVGDKYLTYVNSEVPDDEVITFDHPYRGFNHWHKYTDAQLATLLELLDFLTTKYDIPRCYKGDKMFDLDLRAFEGESGIWTHTSVRVDKTDCNPQQNLINVLKELGGTLDD